MRVFLIVLDSVGIGEAPDAFEYGDCGANTLLHIAESVTSLRLPQLESMGIGNIPSILHQPVIPGIPPSSSAVSSYGAMQEASRGKDTTTGHWEMVGIRLEHGFRLFPPDPPSFPEDLISRLEKKTGRKVLGNKAASGTRIIEELGPYQMAHGSWIVYTSADSVLQIAAHEEVIPLRELYRACEIARKLCNEYQVGRVIARPYTGKPGAFTRTDNRRDYSYPVPQDTVLHRLSAAGIPITTVGKLDDIFPHCGITDARHVENNADAQRIVLDVAASAGPRSFVFANLIDFDMRFGHRRNPAGYAKALADTDIFLAALLPKLKSADMLIVTADHGNDPTFKGTDHTREFVPLLVHRSGIPSRNLGVRNGFYDIAQSIASFFHLEAMSLGTSFI
jgi:phosphopentomutase